MFPWSETDISWELNSAQEIAMFLKDPFLQFLSIKQTHATKTPPQPEQLSDAGVFLLLYLQEASSWEMIHAGGREDLSKTCCW